MASYTIHLPPEGAADDSATERFRLVRDGLSPWAILFWPLWFPLKRLWLGALGVYALWALVNGGLYWLGFSSPVIATSWALLLLLVGLEAHSVERWTLARRGWQEVGVTVAGSAAEAETRAAIALAEADAALPVQSLPPARSVPMRPIDQSILGVFPEPRR